MFNSIEYCLRQIILVLILLVLFGRSSYAVTATDVPQPSNGSYIVDLANILDVDTEAEINKAIATLQQDKNKSIYIVTVPSITEPKPFTSQKFVILSNTSPSRKFLNSIFSNWNIRQLHREYKNKALCQDYRSTFWCSSEGRDRGGSGNW